MRSKPCARGGCTGTVYASGPKNLAKARCCSQVCAYLERVRLGTWCEHTFTPEETKRGGAKAGKVSGRRRHQQALTRASARAFALLPKDIIDTLTRAQLLRLRVAVGKVWQAGQVSGYSKLWMRAKRDERRSAA